MANKLDRIEKDIQKTKSKIAEYQKQLRELEAQKTEQENSPCRSSSCFYHPPFCLRMRFQFWSDCLCQAPCRRLPRRPAAAQRKPPRPAP